MNIPEQHTTENIYRNWLDGDWHEDASSIPAGSPERVLRRFVLESESSPDKYVFEGSDMHRKGHRECQAKTLETLHERNCRHIIPWLRTKNNEIGIDADGYFWQCRKYLPGKELDRTTYANEAWRGVALADFLADLRRSSDSLEAHHHPFYLADYIHSLMHLIEERKPSLHQDLLPIVQVLQPLLLREKEMRLCFCHGDFHPLNVLWDDHGITGVIDWEFAGPKPALYDAANMTGCIGMDNPEFLTGPMVLHFLQKLQMDGTLSPAEISQLPGYMAALRFGWMREWCWRNEKEMMIQELDYIWLLLDNQDLLAKRWEVPTD